MKKLIHIKYLSLFVLLNIMITSCGDGLSTVVDIDLPDADQQLAIHLDLSAIANDTNYFNVVRVVAENEDEGDGQLDIDQLDVSISNRTTGQNFIIGAKDLSFDYEINYAYSQSELNMGDEIELIASYPNLETATCKVFVPAKPPMVSDLLVEPEKDDGFNESYFPVSFTINDPEGEDYYEIKLQLIAQNIELDINGDTVAIETITSDGFTDGYSNDPSIQNSRTRFIVSDEAFNGKVKTLNINLTPYSRIYQNFGGIPSTEVETLKGKLFFNKITKDRYNFERSYQNYLDNSGNPFGTPVSVFSNIENGHGIFSVSNGDVYEFSF